MVSVHVEVLPHLHRTIGFIKKLGAKAGVVLNPSTPVASIQDIAADVDYVLVMSVNPGFGGQVFIPHSLKKIQRCPQRCSTRSAVTRRSRWTAASTTPRSARVVEAGAEILVAGQAVFGGGQAESAARELKALALSAARGVAR